MTTPAGPSAVLVVHRGSRREHRQRVDLEALRVALPEALRSEAAG